jgi:NTP pyrophosphatase (non-canonical NTP hydrolase)
MITKEDMEAFEYYSADEQGDPRHRSPLDMVREYHKVSGLPLDLNVFGAGMEEVLEFRLRLVDEETKELAQEVWKDGFIDCDKVDPEAMLEELTDVLFVVYGYAATFGWNIDEAFIRKFENNMGRMYQPDGTIKRREDGKILKNKHYPKVDLEDLV